MTKEYFAAVYEEYVDSVYRLSLFLTGQREDAEDITQQTFLKFYREDPDFTDEDRMRDDGIRDDGQESLQQFQHRPQQKAWLLKTARNAAYDLLKSADRRKKFSGKVGSKRDHGSTRFHETGQNDLGEFGMNAAWEPRQCTFKEPEEVVSEEQVMLDGLSEKYRAPLYLFYYEEYSTSEIAEILNLSETAVRARLSRGRKQLRKMVEEKGVY